MLKMGIFEDLIYSIYNLPTMKKCGIISILFLNLSLFGQLDFFSLDEMILPIGINNKVYSLDSAKSQKTYTYGNTSSIKFNAIENGSLNNYVASGKTPSDYAKLHQRAVQIDASSPRVVMDDILYLSDDFTNTTIDIIYNDAKLSDAAPFTDNQTSEIIAPFSGPNPPASISFTNIPQFPGIEFVLNRSDVYKTFKDASGNAQMVQVFP